LIREETQIKRRQPRRGGEQMEGPLSRHHSPIGPLSTLRHFASSSQPLNTHSLYVLAFTLHCKMRLVSLHGAGAHITPVLAEGEGQPAMQVPAKAQPRLTRANGGDIR